jgi:deazaflavin-dependent oxidoreductase (nitroreductase family)
MSDRNDFNRQIIEEFRANAGNVDGPFKNTPLLLLTTTGAKSGKERTIPLAYVMDGDQYVIIASKGGAPSNPDWYYNLLAHPNATVEVGTQTFEAVARAVTEEPERSRLYAKMVAKNPGFADYEAKSPRSIPAVLLKRVA